MNTYADPLIRETIELDKFNDFLEKADESCFKMCYTDVYESKDLKKEVFNLNRDQVVCHSNCLDKFNFSKEIMLNNMKVSIYCKNFRLIHISKQKFQDFKIIMTLRN